MSTGLLLSLCVATVIQLTSSQATYDVIEQENNVSSCGRTEQVLDHLMTAVSQLQTAVSQLQRDVAEVNASRSQQTEVTGTLVECIVAV